MPTYEPVGTVAVGANTGVKSLSTFFNNAVSNTAVAVKASAGKLHTFEASNPTTADAFLKFYDTAQGSVTVATDVPKWSILVPAGGGATIRGGADAYYVAPIDFGTAITIACTTESAAGNTAPATAITVNIGYV